MLITAKKTTAIALVLMFVLTTTLMIGLPAVNAAYAIDQYIYITVAPNPIGVDQTAQVTMWCASLPRAPVFGVVDELFHGVTATITTPSGKIETRGVQLDTIAAGYFLYTPTELGNYSFQAHFPEQTQGSKIGEPDITYKKADSRIATLTVQQEQISWLPSTPLPTGYWQRPINAQNRDWWPISGNWLEPGYNASGRFNPYTTAPNTAHIVWTKEHEIGGLVGGAQGMRGYYSGILYEGKWGPACVIEGKLYYRTHLGSSYFDGTACVDLRTGEELWWLNGTLINMGQVLYFSSPDQQGAIPYLWTTAGTTRSMYDARTGTKICDIANASSGTNVMDKNGNWLVYILNGANNWLAMWNSTLCVLKQQTVTVAGIPEWYWRPPMGGTLNWAPGVQWNVTLDDMPGVQSISKIWGDVIYARANYPPPASTGGGSSTPPSIVGDIAYSLTDGHRLWGPINRTAVPTRTTGVMANGVYTEIVKETFEMYGYDIYTGALKWGPSPIPDPDAWAFNFQSTIDSAYGILYFGSYDGRVHAWNITTGKYLWNYYSGNAGLETPYGSWPIYGSLTIADGKVFAPNSEHSITDPIWRGEQLHAVNATTGEGVWSIAGVFQSPVIADGYLVSLNAYDNQLYCFGKGLSETTVAIQDDVVSFGDTILIKGTVTDQSPGDTCLGVPAAGTPVIADKDMSAWMEYLYMQKPKPTNATGVPVKIEVIDSNNNLRTIGTTTSDDSGMFTLSWTPDIEGDYKVIATFPGSESYSASNSETALTVTQAPQAESKPEYPQPVDNTMTIVGVGVALAILIAIVGAVIVLMLRKRP